MFLKSLLQKPAAFAKVWQTRGLRRALGDALQYFWETGQRLREKRRYVTWLAAQQLTAAEIAQVRAAVASWEQPPTFSVLLPVYNIEPALLTQAIESVRSQVYPHWQLILVDDCSPSQQTRAALEQFVGIDDRIQVIFSTQNGGISAATNVALEQATGDYIALLDHDDELASTALYENAQVIREHPEVDILYSDEDKITRNGRHQAPFFKPDWSPEYFHGCMYTCHLGVYRTALVRAIGGFRSEYDGAQDWDLMLRLSEQTQHIHHIPKILYHWRLTATSVTAGAEAKPWAYDAAQRALTDMTLRSPYPGYAEATAEPGFYRVRRQLVQQPLVSIIMPAMGIAPTLEPRSHLETCLDSILKQSTYPHIEWVVVDSGDLPLSILDRVKAIGAELVHCADSSSLVQRINAGVAHSRGEILLLLNGGLEVITPDWVESMLELAQQSAIGAVGAKLLSPDRRIQQAGILLLKGRPKRAFAGRPDDDVGYFAANIVNRNYLCVSSACLMVRRSTFDEVNGLDAGLPLSYSEVDFCLKLHQAGYRNVCTPFAQLLHQVAAPHHPPATAEAGARFQHRWQTYLANLGGDPYYNPNLNQVAATFTLGQ